MTVVQTCLPTAGPGALSAREDPNLRKSKVNHLPVIICINVTECWNMQHHLKLIKLYKLMSRLKMCIFSPEYLLWKTIYYDCAQIFKFYVLLIL